MGKANFTPGNVGNHGGDIPKPPPIPGRSGAPQQAGIAPRTVRFRKPDRGRGLKTGIYGPGGIGKTSLAAMAPGPVVFFDLDRSLGVLDLDVDIIEDIHTWADLRSALQGDGWDGVRTIVIDSVTKAEEMAIAHTLETVRHEKGTLVTSIEGYGFGKGFQHVFDTFLPLLADLDRHVMAGRNVILIAHDCTETVPNPAGDDYIRYEPRLQSPKSGKASIRHRFREEMDNLWFIGYDVIAKDNKGVGSGTRTIYPTEQPHCMAKSRTIQEPIEYIPGIDPVWHLVFGKEKSNVG